MEKWESIALAVLAAYMVFLSYVLACLALGYALPGLAWTYLWALGLALMALLGASPWVHEHQWAIVAPGLAGCTAVVAGLLSQFPLVRSVAGFALSVAYWWGLERLTRFGAPSYVPVEEVKLRATVLSTIQLAINAVAYIFLNAPW